MATTQESKSRFPLIKWSSVEEVAWMVTVKEQKKVTNKSICQLHWQGYQVGELPTTERGSIVCMSPRWSFIPTASTLVVATAQLSWTVHPTIFPNSHKGIGSDTEVERANNHPESFGPWSTISPLPQIRQDWLEFSAQMWVFQRTTLQFWLPPA